MKNFLCYFYFFMVFTGLHGQNPDWSVNPNDYQYSMTFTSFLKIDGSTLSSEKDRVAAFVDNKICGVASLKFIENLQKHVAYLTVYGNTNGKTITFKIYDSTNDKVIEALNIESFKADSNIGSAFKSYGISNYYLHNAADFLIFDFVGINEIETTILDHTITVLVPNNTDITSLTANFSLSSGATSFVNNVKKGNNSSPLNYSEPVIWQILSEDETLLKDYEVTVLKEEVENNEELFVDIDVSFSKSTTKFRNFGVHLLPSEEIQQLDKDDIIIENAFLEIIDVIHPKHHTLILTAINEGEISIEIPAGKITSVKNKKNTKTLKLNFIFDSKSPYIKSIARKYPLEEINNSNVLEFEVIFNEEVTNISANDFESSCTTNIVLQKVNNTTFIIRLNNISNFTGLATLNLKKENNITDWAGNKVRVTNFKN